MANSDALIGSWRMLSWTRETPSTGEVRDVQGPDPVGYIAYHADGRMMAAVFRRDRPEAAGTEAGKAALFDTMLAYVASWTLEEGRVVHHVEAVWDPRWQADLSRPFALDGDRLTISGAPGTDPETGEEIVYRMEFEKV